MKIEIESYYHGDVSLLDVGAEHVTIREAYNGVHLVTEDGEELGVSMRDTGFEVIYLADGRRADLVLKNGSVDAQGDVQSVCDGKSLEGVDRRLSEVEHYVGELLNIPGENVALRDEVARLKAAILEHERRTNELYTEDDITGLDADDEWGDSNMSAACREWLEANPKRGLTREEFDALPDGSMVLIGSLEHLIYDGQTLNVAGLHTPNDGDLRHMTVVSTPDPPSLEDVDVVRDKNDDIWELCDEEITLGGSAHETWDGADVTFWCERHCPTCRQPGPGQRDIFGGEQ